MQVRYQNTAADLQALSRNLPFRYRVWWKIQFPIFVVLCALPATILLAAFGAWYGLVANWLAVLVLASYLLFISWRSTRGSLAHAPETTIRISPESLDVESKDARSRRDWTSVDHVQCTPQHIFLFVAKTTAFAVPRSAFSSETSAEEFAVSATDYFQQAQSSGSPKFVPAPATPTSGELNAQIHFQNTAEQFVQIRHDGLRKPETAQRKEFSFFTWMILSTIGVVFVLFGSRSGPVAQVLSGLFAFVMLGLVSIILLKKILRRVELKMFDREQLRPQTVTLTPQGLFAVDQLCEGFTAWKSVQEIEFDEDFLVIYSIKPQVICLIPKDAFASEQQAEKFQSLALSYYDDSQEAESPVVAEVVETGNPYQPPGSQ